MDEVAVDTCVKCGAKRVGDSEWCTRCFERFTPMERTEPTGPLHATVKHSRTVRSPFTFGFVGRVLATLPFSIVVALLLRDMFVNGNLINVLFVIPILGVGGWVLRDVWQRAPKYVALPPTILGEPPDPDSPRHGLPPDS